MYGGLVAAFAVALGRAVAPPERALRSVNFQLFRPTSPGTLRGTVQLIRAGKYTAFVEVSLSQDEALVARASLVFAAVREAASDISPAAAWTAPNPDEIVSLPYIHGVTPEFVKNVDMRFIEGVPFSGGDPRIRALTRFNVPAGDAEGVVAMLDVLPAPSLATLTSPAPASTVMWTAHVLAAPTELSGWCRFAYDTVVGTGGMHTIRGTLHDDAGTLLGWTEQLVAVFG